MHRLLAFPSDSLKSCPTQNYGYTLFPTPVSCCCKSGIVEKIKSQYKFMSGEPYSTTINTLSQITYYLIRMNLRTHCICYNGNNFNIKQCYMTDYERFSQNLTDYRTIQIDQYKRSFLTSSLVEHTRENMSGFSCWWWWWCGESQNWGCVITILQNFYTFLTVKILAAGVCFRIQGMRPLHWKRDLAEPLGLQQNWYLD